MRRALIGYTGFVGSNLRAQGAYSDLFNSQNYHGLQGQYYDEVVCAGISAVKWLANQSPENDWAGIESLLEVLKTVETKRFVLISTIDVYPDPSKPLDESAELEALPNHPYGRHRLAVEQFVSERFPLHSIVRLPALFGPNLKKNALFDLLNDNETHKINPASSFQWYPITRIEQDLETVKVANLKIVNLFTEPTLTERIVEELFENAIVGPLVAPAPSYCVKTKYDQVFGGANGYIMGADAVIDAMRDYVLSVRSKSFGSQQPPGASDG